MQQKININIVIDVVAALSENTLHNNIFMMDDSIFNSSCQGTEYLNTVCNAGQLIQWNVTAIDVQTPVAIKKIVFINDKDDIDNNKLSYECNEEEDSDTKVWSGIVPWHMNFNIPYKYKLYIQMGEGDNSVMYIDSPALIRI